MKHITTVKNYHQDDLFVDIGNTKIKWRIGNSGNIGSSLISEFIVSSLPSAKNIWVSCVAHVQVLADVKNTHYIETTGVYKNLKCAYKQPTELGVDRWLAMIAAYELHNNKNLLVIDIGSAVTFDLISANGDHHGGLIMPGLMVLRNSFSQFNTSSTKLLLELGNNTNDAWLSGTAQMLIDTVNSRIVSYSNDYKDLVIVLSGGDAGIVASQINYDINVYDNLVLDGLFFYVKSRSE